MRNEAQHYTTVRVQNSAMMRLRKQMRSTTAAATIQSLLLRCFSSLRRCSAILSISQLTTAFSRLQQMADANKQREVQLLLPPNLTLLLLTVMLSVCPSPTLSDVSETVFSLSPTLGELEHFTWRLFASHSHTTLVNCSYMIDMYKTNVTRRVAIIRSAIATQSRRPSPCGIKPPSWLPQNLVPSISPYITHERSAIHLLICGGVSKLHTSD